MNDYSVKGGVPENLENWHLILILLDLGVVSVCPICGEKISYSPTRIKDFARANNLSIAVLLMKIHDEIGIKGGVGDFCGVCRGEPPF